MSTDQYSGVGVDESGTGPSQGGRGQEWPKKIRTLTASELDRLTIDSSGRFYWDGQLVNYEPPESKVPSATPAAVEHTPSDVIEHASIDVIDHVPQPPEDPKSTEAIQTTDIGEPVDTHMHAVATRDDHDVRPVHDLEDVRALQHGSFRRDMAAVELAPAQPVIQVPDRVRVRMTGWQSLGALLAFLCLMIGALGIGAVGIVTMHDWGCRTGLIRIQCPAPPARPMPRSEIPA